MLSKIVFLKNYIFLLIGCFGTWPTGYGQEPDSIANIQIKFKQQQLITPLALTATGIALSVSGTEHFRQQQVAFRNDNLPNFKTKLDDVLPGLPVLAVYLLDASGLPARTPILDRTAIMLKGQLLTYALSAGIKTVVENERPDASNKSSFPSGHTSQVFAAATFLSVEYGQTIRWIPYAAYATASTVGVLRMANNKHYLGDVLVGAALGVVSMKLSYWSHQYFFLKRGNKQTLSSKEILLPYYPSSATSTKTFSAN